MRRRTRTRLEFEFGLKFEFMFEFGFEVLGLERDVGEIGPVCGFGMVAVQGEGGGFEVGHEGMM